MITLFLCYARSGGTVLNQCLGCLPDVMILSEVNPLGGGWGVAKGKSFTTVKAQAKEWYGIEVENDDFTKSIIELESKCKYLIVRDWSFVNFSNHIYNSNNPPNKLLAYKYLKYRCELRTFAFVRNAIDVYLSRSGDLFQFGIEYLRYIEELKRLNIKIFKYEDFCVNPEKIMKEICEYCELPYTSITDKYQTFTTVNGDVQSVSRGQRQGKITTLPRKQVPENIMNIIFRSNYIQKANALLGY